MLFLIAAIAGLGAVRLIAGLLLAVGPFFIAFLLFENTRSLFEGWVRVLAGAALAALGISIALAVELALIEPWLTDLLARRTADEWLPGMPVELLVVTIAFALIVLAMLYASAKTAFAFRLAPVWQAVAARAGRNPAREERRFAAAAAAAGRGCAPGRGALARRHRRRRRRRHPEARSRPHRRRRRPDSGGGRRSRRRRRQPRPPPARPGRARLACTCPARPELPAPHPRPGLGQRGPPGHRS